MDKVLQTIAAALGLVLGWFLGPWDGLLYALVACVAVDYVSGVLCAIYSKTLSSAVGFKGLSKKVMIFFLVGVANVLDQVLGSNAVLRSAVTLFYIANEGISVLENCLLLGLPVPSKLRAVLIQIRTEAEVKDSNKEGKTDEPETQNH